MEFLSRSWSFSLPWSSSLAHGAPPPHEVPLFHGALSLMYFLPEGVPLFRGDPLPHGVSLSHGALSLVGPSVSWSSSLLWGS